MIKRFNLNTEKSTFKEWINKMYEKFSDKEISVEILTSNEVRSLEQNALYWGCIIPQVQAIMQDSTGEKYNDDEVHEWLKTHIGTKVYQESEYYILSDKYGIIKEHRIVDQETFRQTFNMPSTRKMTKAKFTEYLDMIVKWGSEIGFEIKI